MEEEKSVHQKKTNVQASTQLHMPFAEIRDDVIVLKNGGVRGILETSSVNFNLKSEAEQNAIIYSYQNFLNTLEFPIQIVIKSKKLDIDKYIEHMNGLAEKQINPLLKKQTVEYAAYIKKLVEYADIMEKKFYIIVPHDPLGSGQGNIISRLINSLTPKDSLSKIRQRHKQFFQLKKILMQRIHLVTTGIEQCGLRIRPLQTHEIIELLYQTYNPITSRNEKIKNLEDIDINS